MSPDRRIVRGGTISGLKKRNRSEIINGRNCDRGFGEVPVFQPEVDRVLFDAGYESSLAGGRFSFELRKKWTESIARGELPDECTSWTYLQLSILMAMRKCYRSEKKLKEIDEQIMTLMEANIS